MATFGDLNRVIEDTIRVDMKNRWTPQQVKFINNKNEFYGKFVGVLNSTKLSADEADILSARVQSLIIGSGIDLAKYGEYIEELYEKTGQISGDLSVLKSVVEDLCCYTIESIGKLSTSVTTIDDKINIEATNRESEDEKIRTNLELSVHNLTQKDSEIIEDLNNYKQSQEGIIKNLDEDIRKYVDETKHFDIQEIELVGESYQLLDYTVNKIDDIVPYCFVATNTRKIGTVSNVTKDSVGNVFSFTLNILPDAHNYYPSLGTEKYIYNFRNEDGHTEIKTGVGNYRLIWDTGITSKITLRLESEPAKYFDVKDGSNTVARVDSHVFNDSRTGLKYGRVKFNDKLDERMENVQFIFDDDNRRYLNTEKDVEVIYDGSQNFKVTLDVSRGVWYHKLADSDGSEFGRIISGDVQYNDSGDISQIKVSEISGNSYILNESNGFSRNIIGSEMDSVSYVDQKIKVGHLEKYSQFALSAYNSTVGKVIEKHAGFIQLKTCNKSDPIGETVGFKVIITCEDYPEITGTYNLVPASDYDRPDGKSENEFIGYNSDKSLIIKYNKKYSKSLIKVIRKAEMKEIGYFFVDTMNVSIYDDKSRIDHESGVILTDGKVVFDTLDGSGLTIKNVSFDINDEKQEATPSSVEISQIENTSFIQVMIPKKTNSRARVFDLLIEPAGYEDGKFTQVKICVPDEDYGCKFFINGRNVTEDFFINKKRNALRFIELDNSIDNREFQIIDMNNTEILERECVSFMGELKSIPHDNHLSCYFMQGHEERATTLIKHGWLYHAADKTDVMYDRNEMSIIIGENDKMMFKNATLMKDVAVSDFVVYRDAQQEVSDLCSVIFNNFVKLSGDNFISGENTISVLNICSDYVLSSHIENLTSDNSYSKNEIVDELSAGNISVDSYNLMFGDVTKTFNQICSDIQDQISSNDQDISDLSSDYWKTFVKPDSSEYDLSKIPNCLVLKDSDEECVYKLTVSHGLLVVNKI